jgi:hypothetical protein
VAHVSSERFTLTPTGGDYYPAVTSMAAAVTSMAAAANTQERKDGPGNIAVKHEQAE